MKKLIYLIALVVLFSSCENEEVAPSQGEINAKELKRVVEDNNIKGVLVFEPSNDDYREWEMPLNEVMSFTIEKEFITVSYDFTYKVTYDLSKLLKYQINYSNKNMSLYFGR